MKLKTWHLFILSFLIHLAVVLVIRHYNEARLWENGMIAGNVFEGRGFSASFSRENEPTSWQAPGYPYLLVGAWTVFGKTPTAYLVISILQCLAVASMLWPMAALSRRWFPSVPVWVVQVITMLAPLYLWYPTRLHHTAFVMAVHPWLVLAWLDWAGRGPWRSVGAGALTAVAAMFQPVLLGVFGIIGLVRLGASAFAKNWSVALWLCVAGFVVVAGLVPWTVRNYQVHGKLLLVKGSFGKEFWMGNNPHATGTGYGIGGEIEITNQFPPKAFALRGKVSETELMDAMKDEAMEWVRENPGEFVSLTAKKILWFWTLPPKDRVRSTGGAEALLFRGVYLAYWAGLVALAALGLLAIRARPEYLGVLLLFAVFYSLIYGLTHVGQARFRGEIEYLILPASAAGAWWILSHLLRLWSRRPPIP